MLGVAIGLVGRLKNSVVSPYAVLGYKPGLVLDFIEEHYRANSLLTTFDSALTATRAGNATMVDSDGKIKWAPHNLLTYSEQFDNAAWTKSNATVTDNAAVAPDGATTADKIVENSTTGSHLIAQTFTATSGVTYTGVVYAKAAGRSVLQISPSSIWLAAPYANYDLSSGTVTASSGDVSADIEPIGNGWYRCAATFTPTSTGSGGFAFILQNSPTAARGASYLGDGTSGILIWGAHLYRSDLGGMVNNPDRGDSYVPTTSAARYLPRRGHHVYNGYEWVNEGLLHESEARTNLVTYSNLSASWTIGATDSFTKTQAQAAGRDGELSLAKIAITDTTSEVHQIYTSAAITAGATYSLSVDAKFGSHRYWALRYWTATAAWAVVVFDLQTGVVTQTSVGGASGTIVSHGVENNGGIYRVHLSAYTSSGTTGYIAIDACSTGTPTLAASGDGTEAFAGTAGAYSYFGAAQLEQGPTPSSYTPTAGATVTRAAETLTIPSANLPWPAPQYVTGTELVTNGTFDSDVSGWSAAVSYSWVAGRMYRSPGLTDTTFQNITTTAGSVYLLTFDLEVVSTARVSWLGTPLAGITGTGSYSYVVYASGTTSNLNIGASTTASEYYIDNISVKEINPLAVSIAMDGKMTYAKRGLNFDADFFRWYVSYNNQITAYNRTDSANNGQIYFLQSNDAVVDIVNQTSATASPGVNVPYNIASRHGSTFINGAVDGVALTADTTPTALPDLSSTNLSLGFDYMGTIKKFRMWKDDLGDSGIALSSATAPEITGIPTIGVS